MNHDSLTRELLRSAAVLLAVLAVYGFLRAAGVQHFTAPDVEGLNVSALVLGSIYAVILAFVIFVIWGQFNEVDVAIMREAGSLADLLRFSEPLGNQVAADIRRDVTAYAHQVVKYEWAALGEGRKDRRAAELFGGLIETALSRSELRPIALRLQERRNERISRSLTRIPPNLFWFVSGIAAALVLLLMVYPFHNAVTGAFCLTLIVAVLLLANFVMNDLDNPFQGAWNLAPKAFAEVAT